jgi:hypothetical protein
MERHARLSTGMPATALFRFLLPRVIALAAAVVISVAVIGCHPRTYPSVFESPYEAEELAARRLAVDDAAALRAALEARTGRHQQLWVKSEVVITQPGRAGRDFFTALALYEAPDKFRLRGSRTPIGNLFDLLMVGDQVDLFFNREGRLFTGTAAELSEKVSLVGGLSPRDLVGAALIQQSLRDWMANPENPTVVARRGEFLLVAGRGGDAGLQLFWLVRREDALVREFLMRDAGGRELLRISYERYQLEDNPAVEGGREPLPAALRMTVPGTGVSISSTGAQYKLNPGLVARAFERPRAEEVYPLSSLAFEAQPE